MENNAAMKDGSGNRVRPADGRRRMEIRIKRIYEPPGPDDGTRILVDRLWPRGISREAAKIDYWARAVSPSDSLRKWYGHDPDQWPEFRKRYAGELDGQVEEVALLAEKLKAGPVTFLYGSVERKWNNALALKLYLERWMKKRNM